MPGLDIGDDSLDLVADLVIGPAVGVEGQVRGFSPWDDDVQSNVAFVSDM